VRNNPFIVIQGRDDDGLLLVKRTYGKCAARLEKGQSCPYFRVRIVEHEGKDAGRVAEMDLYMDDLRELLALLEAEVGEDGTPETGKVR
jgi:hypothetical protein